MKPEVNAWEALAAAVIVVGLLFSPAVAWTYDTLRIDHADRNYDLASHGVVLADPDARWSVEHSQDLLDAFEGGDLATRGCDDNEGCERYWFLFDIENRTAESDWVLSFHAPLIHRVTLFDSDGSGNHRVNSSGYSVPFRHRLHPALDYALPLSLATGQSEAVLVLIEDPGGKAPGVGDIRLETSERFRIQTARMIAAAFLSLGAVLAVGLYMFLIWARLHEPVYLWFGAFSLASFVLWGTHYELFRILLSRAYDLTLLNFLANGASLAFCILFVRSFLRLDHWSPRWQKTSMVLLCAMITLIGVTPLLDHYTAYQINAGAALVVLIFVMSVGLHAVTSGVERAGVFLAAWAVYFSTGLLTIIDAMGGGLPTVTIRLLTVSAVAVGTLLMAWSVGNQLQELVSQKHFAEMRARTDALTQLGNRASFDDQIIQFQHQYDADLISDILVVFADLDGLKRINDTHGHETGDNLLMAFARLLEERFRNVDGIYRIGGDEFVILIPDAKPTFTEWMPERINRITSHLQERGYPEASVSVGLAMVSEAGGKIQDAVRLADSRMYADKDSNE